MYDSEEHCFSCLKWSAWWHGAVPVSDWGDERCLICIYYNVHQTPLQICMYTWCTIFWDTDDWKDNDIYKRRAFKCTIIAWLIYCMHAAAVLSMNYRRENAAQPLWLMCSPVVLPHITCSLTMVLLFNDIISLQTCLHCWLSGIYFRHHKWTLSGTRADAKR